MNRKDIIDYVLKMPNTFIDYPFKDKKYGSCHVLKHRDNNKWFGIIMQVGNDEYLNVKTNTNYSDLLRSSCDYIIPAYHMNKEHWNSIIINKINDEELVKELIEQSYELTK